MSDSAWKQLERAVADLIGGGRYPANSGYSVDCGPDARHPDCRFVAQSKLVQRMSLDELTALAEKISQEGKIRGKLGLVGVKVRRGAGIKSPVLIVMTDEIFSQLAAPFFQVDGATGTVTRL